MWCRGPRSPRDGLRSDSTPLTVSVSDGVSGAHEQTIQISLLREYMRGFLHLGQRPDVLSIYGAGLTWTAEMMDIEDFAVFALRLWCRKLES